MNTIGNSVSWARPSGHRNERLTGHYDIIVVGATPGGIACALRSSREGVRVLLVEASLHVGGMWTSGLQGFDTRYAGHRCPVLSEFTGRLQEHYRSRFGDGSAELQMVSFGDPEKHGERPRFEPHVAEKVFLEMLAEASGISLLVGYRLMEAQTHDGAVRSLRFASIKSEADILQVSGDMFVDATYEADLAASAGAAFHVGRESREEFGENHAGRHFTTIEPIGDHGLSDARHLGLHFFNRTSRREFPGSTGEGDGAVQAYTLRLSLTDLPENRRPIARPPGYDRRQFEGILDRTPEAHDKGYPLSSSYLHSDVRHLRLSPTLPNRKTDWLGANFVGRNHDYPTASFAIRKRIYEEHVAHALGTLYFLQNDSSVPAEVRADYGRWGLARDEFVDTGNIPRMMYVREARRLRGLHVFTEHDATRHPGHERTPIHLDSVAFAEWPMDSHDCNPARQPGSFNDGEFILAEQTLPSQIPLRCMVSAAVENLLVPVCLSSTHVGWGTLRLEPVMVHMGEVAGVVAASCLRLKKRPGDLDAGQIQWELLNRHITISYLADVDLSRDSPSMRAAQYLSTRGFFGSYHARLLEDFDSAERDLWERILAGRLAGGIDPNVLAGYQVSGGVHFTGDADLTIPSDEIVRGLIAAAGLERGGTIGRHEALRVFCSALRSGEGVVAPA